MDTRSASNRTLTLLLVTRVGCHDNGYVTTLRSQITAGFGQKLILLRSYTEMATGVSELGLTTLSIPDLFLPRKLCAAVSVTNAQDGLPSQQTWMSLRAPPGLNPVSMTPFADQDDGPAFALSADGLIASYSAALALASRKPPTPELDDTTQSTSSESDTHGDNVISNYRGPPSVSKRRHVNANIVEFYMA